MNINRYSPLIKSVVFILLLFVVQMLVNLVYQQPILNNFFNLSFIITLYIIPYLLSFTKWNLFYQFLIFLLISFGYFTTSSFLVNSYVDYTSILLQLAISFFTAFVMLLFSLVIRKKSPK